MLQYISRVGIAVSVLLNVILGGCSNQTFSARNYQRKRDGKLNLVALIDSIYFATPNHCLHSWAYWATRQKLEVPNE